MRCGGRRTSLRTLRTTGSLCPVSPRNGWNNQRLFALVDLHPESGSHSIWGACVQSLLQPAAIGARRLGRSLDGISRSRSARHHADKGPGPGRGLGPGSTMPPVVIVRQRDPQARARPPAVQQSLVIFLHDVLSSQCKFRDHRTPDLAVSRSRGCPPVQLPRRPHLVPLQRHASPRLASLNGTLCAQPHRPSGCHHPARCLASSGRPCTCRAGASGDPRTTPGRWPPWPAPRRGTCAATWYSATRTRCGCPPSTF